MDRIDGFLTERARKIHNQALVRVVPSVEVGFPDMFILEIPEKDSIALGPVFAAARKSLDGLIRQKRKQR